MFNSIFSALYHLGRLSQSVVNSLLKITVMLSQFKHSIHYGSANRAHQKQKTLEKVEVRYCIYIEQCPKIASGDWGAYTVNGHSGVSQRGWGIPPINMEDMKDVFRIIIDHSFHMQSRCIFKLGKHKLTVYNVRNIIIYESTKCPCENCPYMCAYLWGHLCW